MNQTSYRQLQLGAGLIEILVSVLVLSVGFLGVAALQLRALGNNESALDRSLAVIQAHSIGDTLRIAKQQAVAGTFNLQLEDATPTGQDFVQSSLARWRQSLSDLLGEQATCSVDCQEEDCSIVVQWQERRAVGNFASNSGDGVSTVSLGSNASEAANTSLQQIQIGLHL